MGCLSIALIQVVVQIVLFSTANSQTQLQPIVNVDPIQDGRPFTITCAADRVILATQDPGVTRIFGLAVWTNTTDSPTSTIAQYHPFEEPKDQQYTKPGLPVGWIVNFSGGNNTRNRQTIKIEIIIPKATCSQAGLYICGIQYLDGEFKQFNKTQNLTAEAATEEPVLSLLPQNSAANAGSNYSTYDLGETVTMTCRVTGQKNLAMKWQRQARPAFGSDPYEDYPVQTDITTEAPVETQSSGACSQFTHVSRLKFNVSEQDTRRIYQCVISGGNVAPLTVSATIDVVTVSASVPPATGTQDGGPSKGSVGMIVGIVIGSVAAVVLIIIVICCVCHRRSKKKKEDNYPDQPDGDVNPPPYPHVPARTPYETNPYNRGPKAQDVSGGQEIQPSSAVNYKKREGKPQDPNQYSDDNYNHQQKAGGRYRNQAARQDDIQYKGTDFSHEEDETTAQLVAPPVKVAPRMKVAPPPVKEKPKTAPKPKPQIPERSDEDHQLQYAQLDLQQNRNAQPESVGRRKTNTSVQYAEISV